jgi:hypothetical protein
MKFSPNFFSFEKLEKFFFPKPQGICDKIFLFHFFCCPDVKVHHQKQKKHTGSSHTYYQLLRIQMCKEDWIILIKNMHQM